MLDLDLLHSFISVVEAGGFTRAGERVHRTQSTVSQQIRRLEETVGQPLLHRNGKQVSLTEQGERLLSYARRILALEQEAREVATRERTPEGHKERKGVKFDDKGQNVLASGLIIQLQDGENYVAVWPKAGAEKAPMLPYKGW